MLDVKDIGRMRRIEHIVTQVGMAYVYTSNGQLYAARRLLFVLGFQAFDDAGYI